MSEKRPGPLTVWIRDEKAIHADILDQEGYTIATIEGAHTGKTWKQMHEAVVSLAHLFAAAPALLAALRAVEWIERYDGPFYCPECLNLKYEGHAPDCQLAAALRAAEGEGE